MKACPQHQQNLTLLAAGVLSELERDALQSHVAACSGCREYLRELSEICREHSAIAENAPRVEVSSDFHQRLVRRIEASEPVSTSHRDSPIRTWLTAWRWRIALPLGAAIVIFIVLVNLPRPRVEVASPLPIHAIPSVINVARVDSPTTLLAYRRAAGQSPEALDALLARDAAQSSGPSVRVTAFTRDLSALTD
ncbi:MAG: zf-HC2 domain-containing protein [Verrucomicrobia bacterium]|nr:zf-HC2 domain-containing protein [Verrucomicrobiota bacterium]